MTAVTVVDPVGRADIARRVGVTPAAVGNWASRYDDFPPPVFTVSGGPVWAWPDVARWLTARGRPSE